MSTYMINKKNPVARLFAAHGGFMKHFRLALAAALCAMLMFSLAIPSHAAKAKAKDRLEEIEKAKAKAANVGSVKHSGKTFRNKRIKLSSAPNVEIVEGKISGFGRDGIYMDGEFFKIGYADIKAVDGRDLKIMDLRYGLKARITLSYGTIDKTIIYGLRRGSGAPPPDVLKMMVPENENRGTDWSLPPELREENTQPPIDGPEGR